MDSDVLVLCRGTIPAASFRERVIAAAAAGYGGISLFAADYQSGREGGLSDADMRGLLADHGLAIAELDPLMHWIPGRPHAERGAADEAAFYAIAAAIGARSINAAIGVPGAVASDRVAESFAGVCDRAREHGLLVPLAFLPWTAIDDVRKAVDVVRLAGRENGGVMFDTWHHLRSGLPDSVIDEIPAERIIAIQTNDAPREAEENLVDETLHRRLLPGEGDIDLPGIFRRLFSGGCKAPVGVEIFSDELAKLPFDEAARLAADATRRVLAQARC
jgi:sugar phosphate isomerase/epimerase